MVDLDAQGLLQGDGLVRMDASLEYRAQRAIEPFNHRGIGLAVRVQVPDAALVAEPAKRGVEEFLALICLQEARRPLTFPILRNPRKMAAADLLATASASPKWLNASTLVKMNRLL